VHRLATRAQHFLVEHIVVALKKAQDINTLRKIFEIHGAVSGAEVLGEDQLPNVVVYAQTYVSGIAFKHGETPV
jgi:hypothetical protein